MQSTITTCLRLGSSAELETLNSARERFCFSILTRGSLKWCMYCGCMIWKLRAGRGRKMALTLLAATKKRVGTFCLCFLLQQGDGSMKVCDSLVWCISAAQKSSWGPRETGSNRLRTYETIFAQTCAYKHTELEGNNEQFPRIFYLAQIGLLKPKDICRTEQAEKKQQGWNSRFLSFDLNSLPYLHVYCEHCV